MNILEQLRQTSTLRIVACVAFTLVAVAVVAVWAAHMSGDTSQTAAMLGASIAVTAAAASGRRSCRPASSTRGRRSAHR